MSYDTFIYGLVDPRTEEIRYVGQTARGMTRPLYHGRDTVIRKERTYKRNWVKSLKRLGLTYSVKVLEEVSLEKLAEREQYWIAYGREQGWPLTNQTEGGPGTKGFQHSCATKKRMSRKRKGASHTAEWMAPAGNARRGKPHSIEAKAKISEARRRCSMAGKRASIRVAETSSGRVFDSVREAARAFSMSTASIRWILKGGQTYTGLTFREV